MDNSALRALTENLQNIQIKDIKGENVGNISSYLKGSLILLQNCGKMPTDTISLLLDIFCSAELDEFTTFISNVYFNHKRKTHEVNYMDYITLAKSEYRTLYRKET